MRGRFITLEGVDGAGKSTHLDFIAESVRGGGHNALVTREPGGTELAERVRAVVLAEPMDAITVTLLLLAARADHVARVIRPALEGGTWVVCDRFSDATFAYQGAGKGVPAALLQQLSQAAHPGLAPDLTLVFDCDYEVARQRLLAAGRTLDRFEREERAFFDRVRASYRAAASAEPKRVRLIDASADKAAIRNAVSAALGSL